MQSMKLMCLPSNRRYYLRVHGSSPQDFKTCLARLRVIKMGPNKNALDRSKKETYRYDINDCISVSKRF